LPKDRGRAYTCLRVMNYLEGPLSSSSLSFVGVLHIGTRALLDPKLIWYGYITLAYVSTEKGGNLLA
jgi:hypothetical protein